MGSRRCWLPAGSLPTRPSGQPPSHLAVREQRARARRLLHPDPLRRTFEFLFALLRAEEVAALLVLAARRAIAVLHRHAADGVVRTPFGPAVARVHVPPPRYMQRSPRFASATPHLRTR